jgi:hypothetical protein
LAGTEWERDLVQWLAEHDQTVFGLGVVSFDLDEIAWTRDAFDDEKAFMLAMIDLAGKRHRWEVLPYDPPFAGQHLAALRALVERFQVEHVVDGQTWSWRFDERERDERCPTHAVFVHGAGCPICRDVVL